MGRIYGAIVGAIQGTVLGLLISLFLGTFRVFFPCDIIAGCSLVCAVIGYICGEKIVSFLADEISRIMEYLPNGPN